MSFFMKSILNSNWIQRAFSLCLLVPSGVQTSVAHAFHLDILFLFESTCKAHGGSEHSGNIVVLMSEMVPR